MTWSLWYGRPNHHNKLNTYSTFCLHHCCGDNQWIIQRCMLHGLDFIALWWWFAHAVLGVPCETTRHGCSLWCLYPHYPFSIHIFCLVINIEKTSLVKILGNFSFVSIYYHWNWFEDLHHVQGIEIKDDSEMLHSQYLRENNGTTCHHGHPADCQLALRNVVEVQTKVVTND